MKLHESFEEDFIKVVEDMSEWRLGCNCSRNFAIDKNGELHYGDIHVGSGNYTIFNFDVFEIFNLDEYGARWIKKYGIKKFAAKFREWIEEGKSVMGLIGIEYLIDDYDYYYDE